MIQINGSGITLIKGVGSAGAPRRGSDVANSETAALLETVERDVRLDFFRGIGLWMIFLDHIPHDVVSWLTLRNYGFSDAAEFFVFISGYLVGFIYAPVMKAISRRRSFMCNLSLEFRCKRAAIMHDGVLQQVGTPTEVYLHPANQIGRAHV